MDTTQMLNLGLLVGVFEGGSTDMAHLGSKFTRVGPFVDGQADTGSLKKGDQKFWFGLPSKMIRCDDVTSRVYLYFP
jgi:hypothetical protein